MANAMLQRPKTKKQPLTPRQQEILDWIVAFMAQHQMPPTLRDICAAFGFASPNGAMCHLQPMAQKGWLSLSGGKGRGLTVHVDFCPYCGSTHG